MLNFEITLPLTNLFSFGVAAVVGGLAVYLVFNNAQKIGGGALAKVYRYFGLGMLFNLAGFLVADLPMFWALYLTQMRVHDMLFVAGYTAMALGAKKILDAAGLT